MQPNILDMFHGDNREAVPDFGALQNAGIWGIIHKTSQGADILDARYMARRIAAAKVGMPFMAYHFMTGINVAAQVKQFLMASHFDDKELPPCGMMIDYEKSGSTPTLQQLHDMVQAVDAAVPNVSCVIYSGDLIRETLLPHPGGHQNASMVDYQSFFAMHRLLLAEYGPHENVPWPWRDAQGGGAWAWQYSETGRVNPIVGAVDLNYYAGTKEQLAANWLS